MLSGTTKFGTVAIIFEIVSVFGVSISSLGFDMKSNDLFVDHPTLAPHSGSNGSPSAAPNTGTQLKPSAEPSTGTQGNPSVKPNIGTNGNPTTGPQTGNQGNPSASPLSCTNGWTDWINKHTPTDQTFDVEHEYMTAVQLGKFCSGGNIVQIICETVDGIPSESSGEIITCNRQTGLTCNNVDNSPIPCSDYQVKYECKCPGMCI